MPNCLAASVAVPESVCRISARCARLGGRRCWTSELTDRRSGYPLETVVKAADAGWRIAEVDVDYLPRSGRSKVTGTPLGAARAVKDMSKVLSA